MLHRSIAPAGMFEKLGGVMGGCSRGARIGAGRGGGGVHYAAEEFADLVRHNSQPPLVASLVSTQSLQQMLPSPRRPQALQRLQHLHQPPGLQRPHQQNFLDPSGRALQVPDRHPPRLGHLKPLPPLKSLQLQIRRHPHIPRFLQIPPPLIHQSERGHSPPALLRILCLAACCLEPPVH